MALTLRKKKGLIIPKTPKLILPSFNDESFLKEKIIEEEIQRILKEKVRTRARIGIRRLDFIPIYSRNLGEKEIVKIHIKNRYTKFETIIDVNNDIESTGVTLLEFFDYIILAGAQEIQDPNKALEIM